MERKLMAIFSADVQGYSRLMGEDEEATIRTLTAYRELMTSCIRQHRGRVDQHKWGQVLNHDFLTFYSCSSSSFILLVIRSSEDEK